MHMYKITSTGMYMQETLPLIELKIRESYHVDISIVMHDHFLARSFFVGG